VLDEQEADTVGSHLATCPACDTVAVELEAAGDPWLGEALRPALAGEDFSAEAECRAANGPAEGGRRAGAGRQVARSAAALPAGAL